MGAITDSVNAALSAAEKLALGAVKIDGAVADALLRYSTDFPLERAELCAVDGDGVVTLPAEWVEGWSNVSALGYPVAGPLPDAQSDGVTINFTVADWVLDAGQYYLDLTHNLESPNVITQFWEGATQSSVSSISVVSSNRVRAFIPAIPDSRFAGRAYLERVN